MAIRPTITKQFYKLLDTGISPMHAFGIITLIYTSNVHQQELNELFEVAGRLAEDTITYNQEVQLGTR